MAYGVGSPPVQVDITQVMQLRILRMSLTRLGEIMGVSRCTLYRGLENTEFTDLTDQEPDQLIADYTESHSHDGMPLAFELQTVMMIHYHYQMIHSYSLCRTIEREFDCFH